MSMSTWYSPHELKSGKTFVLRKYNLCKFITFTQVYLKDAKNFQFYFIKYKILSKSIFSAQSQKPY